MFRNLVLIAVICLLSFAAKAQTTEFTFQGSLKNSGAAANGNHDFEFRLFDSLVNGTQLGSTLTRNAVTVTNGVFAVTLDFGSQFPGANRFLEIRVRQSGGGGFTPLTPLQQLSSAPYSVKSLNAENAVNATTANTATTATTAGNVTGIVQIANGGTGSSTQNFVDLTTNQTVGGTKTFTNALVAGTFTGSGAGLTNLNATNITSGTLNNARLGILPFANGGTGSATQNFVDLTTAQTIGGNKTFSNTLSGNAVNSATQFNIGGSRVLSVANFNLFAGLFAGTNTIGGNNSFFGIQAGQANTDGNSNSFFGTQAGRANISGNNNSFFGNNAGTNTIGGNNSFVGFFAGRSNTMGSDNSFFGWNAGTLNTEGSGNLFLGLSAGSGNTMGSNNTIVGTDANVFNFTNATAIGYRAFVAQSDSLVLGSINGVNGATADTKVGIGTTAPSASLHIATNGGRIRFGDMGCSSPATGISFGSTVLNCTNYSMLGDGIGTLFNRPLGGNMDFRENNVVQMSIAAGGVVRIVNLAGATATTLCRTALNEIAACTSSLRYKEKINSFNSGLDLIKRLRPVSFNWIGGGDLDLGLIAEEVEKVEPLLVTRDNKGEIEGVKYDRVGVVLVNAVQEQQVQIQSQQKQLDEQNQLIKLQKEKLEITERQMKQHRSELEALKTLVCSQNRNAELCTRRN